MQDGANWLIEIDRNGTSPIVDGLVPVDGYDRSGRPPEEVEAMEKAKAYERKLSF